MEKPVMPQRVPPRQEEQAGRSAHAKLIHDVLIPGSECNILRVPGSADAIKSKGEGLVSASGY